MTENNNSMNRRNFLKTAGTVTAVGLAGCTGDEENSPEDNTPNGTPDNGSDTPTEDNGTDNDTENGTDEPDDSGVTFEELYSEAGRKSITGETLSQNTGPFNLNEVEAMLSPSNSEAENVAIAATQASMHTREREDTPYTIRHVLSELDLDAFAQERRTGAGAKTDIYVEDGSNIKKVAATKTPHNARNPIQYTLIGGEEPTTGDGAKGDNNIVSDWNEDNLASTSYLDLRAIGALIEEADNSEVDWKGLADNVKTSYLLNGGVEGSEIDFTQEAGRYMANLEDIDNSDYTEAFEAYTDANEVYHNDVVPEEQHLLVELSDGGLEPRAVTEETLEEEGFFYQNMD